MKNNSFDIKMNGVDSDLEEVDFNNYKGIYDEIEEVKYCSPKTGAHFKFKDLSKRIKLIK